MSQKGLLRKEMSIMAMEKLVDKWSKRPPPDLHRPKDLQPYSRGGTFLPSPRRGLPHTKDTMKSYFEVTRELRGQWLASLTAAFQSLKELAET